ncbi:hypothetical protein VHUM_04374 [Vanrija humicola]|uniref:Major facilitator superfamily (MFS) profile domain-containing protein n=1 Tax=Vanrija humicola TaxID=5417 RepID=A0A7D8V235_VANHU|nr:hypothetical protein VHUM_04374 [Vanrija humicola]
MTIDVAHPGPAAATIDHSRTLPRRPWRPWTTPWSAIREQVYKGSGTESDPYVVDWLPNDVEDPYNYSVSYKWTCTLIAATGTLAVTMGSSSLSGAIHGIKADFPGYNNMVYIMVTGIYLGGFVLGPFLWAPASEVYGRRMVYVVTMAPFTVLCAGLCGAQNVTALLVLRFLAGTFGCSSMTNAGGLISDMFRAKDRGLAMGVFGAMPWLGPALGPIVGGFLSPISWRWAGAVVAIFAGVLALLHLVYLPETYAPVLLRQRANTLSRETGQVYRCVYDAAKPFSTRELIKTQLKVPFILLFTEPIVFVLSLYLACIFSILYLQFTSFPIVFQGERHWSPGISSLSFLGTSIGCNVALLYMVFWGNPAYAKSLKQRGYLPPEARLPSAISGALLIPIGLFIFAWTCSPTRIPWIISILATVPFGAGMVLVFLACTNYLVDAYLHTAASVLGASTVTRSIMAVILPLFTVDMYDALGVNWASSVCAFISLAFTPVPFLLIAYGPRIRRMTKHGREADEHGLAIAATRAASIAAHPEAGNVDVDEKWGTIGEDVRTPIQELDNPIMPSAATSTTSSNKEE